MMRKIIIAGAAIVLFPLTYACKKSDTNGSSAKTVQNLSGSYGLADLTVTYSGLTLDLYDSLPACEKDNTIQLETNGTAQFIDAGMQCVPPSDSSGTWSLSPNGDSLYIQGSGNLIKSWDGKTLVLTGIEYVQTLPFASTTTLVKK
jgi:hypothetical protein